jgi:hypothetical protein
MKNIKLKPLNLLFNFVMIALIGIALVGLTPAVLIVAGILALVVGTLLGFVPSAEGSLYMPLSREIWRDQISQNLYKNNKILEKCRNNDDFVVNARILHIPQAGGAPVITKNRSLLPASVLQRVDTDLTIALDEYTTDPYTVIDAETVELSYDKMDSVMYDHMNALKDTIVDNMCINWAPTLATRILRTNATALLVNTHIAGSTGQRRAFTADDLQAAMIRLKKDNVGEGEMIALMSVDMYNQLITSVSATPNRNYLDVLDPKTGLVASLFGFTIMVRNNAVVYDNSATPLVKAYGAAATAADNDAVICFHRDFVWKAQGEIKIFDQQNSPQYYGDMMSALVRFASGRQYANQRGIVSIVQIP